MARVVGTKKTHNTLNEGVIGDVPGADWDPVAQKLIDDGYQEPAPELERSTDLDIANGIVRGDAPTQPDELARAKTLRKRAYDIALTGDLSAKEGDATPDLEEEDHLYPIGSFDPGDDYTLGGVGEQNRQRLSEGRVKDQRRASVSRDAEVEKREAEKKS